MGLIGLFNGLQQIWAHKVRSTLTILGIVLGVAATMTVIGLIQGLMANWMKWFTAEGGLEKIYAENIAPPPEQQHLASLSEGFTLRDALALMRNCPLISEISPEVDLYRPTIERRGRLARLWIMQGVGRGTAQVGNYQIGQGRYITDTDVDQCAPVAVLGAPVMRELFNDKEDPLGQSITINGLLFRVVGIMKHVTVVREGWREEEYKGQLVFVPVTTMLRKLKGGRQLTWLNAKVRDADALTDVVRQVENVLAFSHRGIRDYRVNTQEGIMQDSSAVAKSYSFTLAGIATVSLLVGGIGILNVMLASLNERIREIGLRKAMGARNSSLFLQFLGEAVLLAAVGGVLGVLLGTGTISFLQTSAVLADTAPPILSFPAGALAFAVSVAVGIVSGLYPALRAAQLNPIVALRF